MRRALVAGLVALGGGALALGVAAQSESVTAYNIEVSPIKTIIELDRGEEHQLALRVGNQTAEEQTFFLKVNDFIVEDEQGSPQFLEPGAQRDTSHSLSEWLRLSTERLVVSAGSTEVFTVTISVPENAEPGGHSAGGILETVQGQDMVGEDGGAINAIGRIASPILVSVPGAVTESLELTSLSTNKRIYWEGNPTVKMRVALANTGNVHVSPTGAFFITGGFAAEPTSLSFNQAGALVLPNSPERVINDKVTLGGRYPLIPPFGRFTAEFTARYGADSQAIGDTASFWVLPIRFMLLLLVALLVAVIFVVLVVREFKYRRKRRRRR